MWEQTKKQSEAWDRLIDDTVTDLLFGGGAGGAKSFLGCAWIILMAGKYAGTRWLVGRKKLKSLKETTLNTFWDVCSMWGIKEGRDYKYDGQANVITLQNGSEILLKDLFLYPADPNFDSLGSLEITGGFLDEVNQLVFKAVEVVRSRIRYKLTKFCIVCGCGGLDSGETIGRDAKGIPVRWRCKNCKSENGGLIPKLLMTCNPSKNWPYMEFYKPAKEGKLPKEKKFIQALAKDNPFISRHYIAQLKSIKDKPTRERLLKGNWEYDDDPASMFPFDVITDLFTTKARNREGKFISGDISRKGRDVFPVGYWEGFQLKEIHTLPYELRKSTAKSAKWIIDLADKKGVRRGNIVLDEDGVGGGVVDNVPGCVGFVNGSAPVKPNENGEKQKTNYANLKSQCYFTLARLAEEGEIGIDGVPDEIRNAIVEELGEIKQKDIDKDGKLAVVGKEVVKESLGRSPDYADMIMMRMIFDLLKRPEPRIRHL